MAGKRKAPAKKKEAALPAYIGLTKREDGWWWEARAANHKEVASSGEGYSNRGAAIRQAKGLFPGLDIVPV